MSRISLTCLVLLCCLSLAVTQLLTVPAHAAIAAYDPDDYVSEVVINGDIKTVTFDFGLHDPWINMYEHFEDGSNKKYTFTGTAEMWTPSADAIRVYGMVYPLGVQGFIDSYAPSGGVIDVSDIMPGASLTFDISWTLTFALIPNMSLVDATVTDALHVGSSVRLVMYDADGAPIGNIKSADQWDYIPNTPSHSFHVGVETVAELPSDCKYILPFFEIQGTEPQVPLNQLRWNVVPQGFAITTDINMVYQDSVTMDRINDKLDDITAGIQDTNDKLDDVNQGIQDTNDKLDDVNQGIQDTNDKLDDIYTGGDAGDSLIDAGDDLAGSSAEVSDAVGGLDDDLGGVSDFEAGEMEHIEYAFDQIAVVDSIGQFNTSLAFVSDNLQLIFEGLEEWQIAVTLPMFIGLFFGLCQHVGGIANLRYARAREARIEELHQARLDKIRGGGK